MKFSGKLLGVVGLLLWLSACRTAPAAIPTPEPSAAPVPTPTPEPSAAPTSTRTQTSTPASGPAATTTSIPGELIRTVSGLILPDGAFAWRLQGDYEYVGALAYSPDSTQLAIASSNGVFVYQSDSLELQMTLPIDHQPTEIAWSPEGKRLAVGSNDGTVAIWDVAAANELAVFEIGYVIRSVSWSPDGRQIAAGAYVHDLGDISASARLLDVATGETTVILDMRGKYPYFPIVAWSPDGSRLAGACMCEGGRIWDAVSGEGLLDLEGYKRGSFSSWSDSIAWSPMGDRLAIGLLSSPTSVVMVYDPATGERLAALTGHTAEIFSLEPVMNFRA